MYAPLARRAPFPPQRHKDSDKDTLVILHSGLCNESTEEHPAVAHTAQTSRMDPTIGLGLGMRTKQWSGLALCIVPSIAWFRYPYDRQILPGRNHSVAILVLNGTTFDKFQYSRNGVAIR